MLFVNSFVSRLYPTIHQTKGWNARNTRSFAREDRVFILQSIKPRVETPGTPGALPGRTASLSYNPSNQGLKRLVIRVPPHFHCVFILQSIKPRVETEHVVDCFPVDDGLYPTIHQTKGWNFQAALRWLLLRWSLSYNPSNQGLKPIGEFPAGGTRFCLYPTIHQTKGWNGMPGSPGSFWCWSLSYNPSNQGLKLGVDDKTIATIRSLYPTIHQTKGWNTH